MRKVLGLGLCLLGAAPAFASGADNRLAQAVRGDDHAAIKRLLAAHVNVNAPLADKSTVLAWAVDRQDVESVHMLLAAGAKPNTADIGGQTALMWAAFKGRTENIKFLLAHGANVNAASGKGFTPLFFALRSKEPSAPLALLDAGANSKSVLPDGTSVVAAAVANGNVPFAVTAVSRGTDLTERDSQGRQLIHVAAVSGNADLVKMVLSKGVDANAMSVPPTAPAPPPVQVASGGQKVARADGTRPPSPPAVPKTPLIFAAEAGSAPAMKALVDAGAKVSIKAPDGTTVALAAAGSGNLDAVKYALQLDPDLTAIGPNHRSIMHYAIANKNPDLAIPVLQYLADKGAKMDEKNEKGDTPADFINRGGQQDIRIFFVQLLKDKGVAASLNH